MTIEDRLEALRLLAIFKDVDEDSLRVLAELGEAIEFPPNHVIAREGQLGSGLFLILKGERRALGRQA